MDFQSFREYCLGLGDVEEKIPFGKFARKFDSTVVFYVCGHMFALCDLEDFTSVGLRLDSVTIDDLFLNKSSVAPPVNRAMKLWVSIVLGGDISDSEVLNLTREAFEIVKVKYSRK